AAGQAVLRGESCAPRVSGLCLNDDQGAELLAKAAELRRALQAEPRSIYMTANSYFMPLLTGVMTPLRERDAFQLPFSNADFDRLVAEIGGLAPPCLLLDAPDSLFQGSVFHRRFYARLRVAIDPSSAYVRRDAGSEWSTWCRR